jgi:hypothetical protein
MQILIISWWDKVVDSSMAQRHRSGEQPEEHKITQPHFQIGQAINPLAMLWYGLLIAFSTHVPATYLVAVSFGTLLALTLTTVMFWQNISLEVPKIRRRHDFAIFSVNKLSCCRGYSLGAVSTAMLQCEFKQVFCVIFPTFT